MKVIEISAIWCSSCLYMRPIYDSIYKDFNLDVERLDYDMDDISAYDVGSILPVLIIGDNRFVGEVKDKKIRDYLREIGCSDEK